MNVSFPGRANHLSAETTGALAHPDLYQDHSPATEIDRRESGRGARRRYGTFFGHVTSRGSRYFNHPELVLQHPAHLASPVKSMLEKVRYSEPPRTPVKAVYKPCKLCEGVEGSVPSNHPERMCGRPLHTLLAL